MASTVIDSNKIKTLSRLIDRAGNVVITCHLSPDGDALGASLAMAGIMSSLPTNRHNPSHSCRGRKTLWYFLVMNLLHAICYPRPI